MKRIDRTRIAAEAEARYRRDVCNDLDCPCSSPAQIAARAEHEVRFERAMRGLDQLDGDPAGIAERKLSWFERAKRWLFGG